MYLGFNVLLIVLKITDITSQEKIYKLQLFFYFLLCTIFLVFITLLASKAGILIITTLIVGITGLQLFKKKFYLFFYLMSLAGVLFYFLTTNTNAPTTRRFTDAKNELITNKSKKSEEKKGSSNTRVEVWKATSQLIKNNYLIGVGTGDIKDELSKQYKKNNFKAGIELNYNCHNQYLQFTLISGILGGLILILILSLSFIYAYKSRNQILLLFVVLIALNMLMESMLETKAGVEFYAFFLPFLLKNKVKFEG